MLDKLIKIIIVVGLIILGILIYNRYFKGKNIDEIIEQIDELVEQTEDVLDDIENKNNSIDILDNYFPFSSSKNIIQHQFFTLAYSEKDEQAQWVAYELTKANVNSFIAERTNDFREDKKIKTGSASIYDYRGSGYDRGHLCPAGDMTFTRLGMSESFYMSNMSPQHRSFNRGVWKELEQQTRDWVRANQHLYIVTGPVLRKRENHKIGKNKVSVPKAYYKVLLDLKEPVQKGIAFLIPNEKQIKRLEEFELTIDELEEKTGIDFFPHLPDLLEEKIEKQYNPSHWIYDEERFQLRLKKWNYE